MASRSVFIRRENNLSVAWARAFLALLEPGVDDLIPLVINVAGFGNGTPDEVTAIRELMDASLEAGENTYSAGTTANLIFPENLWLRYRSEGRDAFFHHYLNVTFPRLQRADRRNAKGIYFERMIAYGADRRNQLADILDIRSGGNPRRSVLQLVVFDPTRDHTNSRYLDFPCLDYVAFAPDGDGGLSVTAFYAMQYVFDRGYGNYLGLCALGRFVAGELGLEFRQLSCVAGVAKLGSIKQRKRAARAMGDAIRDLIPAKPETDEDRLEAAN